MSANESSDDVFSTIYEETGKREGFVGNMSIIVISQMIEILCVYVCVCLEEVREVKRR
jgi:hypothetical protein